MFIKITRRDICKIPKSLYIMSSYRGNYRGEGGGSGSRGSRHPSHLKGKEIGLFYARRSKQKSQEREKEQRSTISMDHHHEQHISNLLEKIRKTSDFKPSYHQSKKIGESSSTASCNDQEDAMDWLDSREKNQTWNRYQEHLKESFRAEEERQKLHNSSITCIQGDQSLDLKLKTQLLENMQKSKYQKMLEFRKKLPSYNMRREIVKLIEGNQSVVISGETGCGKTTQVTQFLLDHYIEEGKGSLCRIVCTQPRRISAISVAERVAEERAESCGNNSSIGYQIRLECKLPREKGSILYCTTGILLQRMQNDPYLSKISHIILDEIHERDLDSEFLIIILKDLLKQRQDLKVILMSATLNAEQFSQYFGNCPMLNIPGFTFPVKEYLLEDVLEMIRYEPKFNRKNSQENMTPWKRHTKQGKKLMEKERERQEAMGCYLRTLEGSYSSQTIKTLWDIDEETIDLNLIFSLLRYICIKQGEGAVLVFLPGWEHISKLHKIINDDSMFNSSRYLIIPLHSLMPTVNQKAVFNRPPPGVRKIILATNIAETSITIDDIVFVIDSGKIKISNFDVENNIATLKPEWVALANARQRKGRAGRVQEGICYHLYSKLTESQLQNYQLPEILRTRLETLCLRIKILKLGKIEVFLNKAMQPPDPKALELSINLLEKLNALDEKENLTPLGFHLAQLPLDPHTGKMILMGAIFSCLDPILTVAASLSFKDAFVIPLGKEEQADRKRKQIARNSKSDHLMLVQAFNGWEAAMKRGYDQRYCWENFLSHSTLKMLANLKKQFTQYLHELQFLHCNDPKHKDFNRNSENQMLLKAVICAGLYPNVAKLQWRHNRNPHKSPKIPKVYTEDDGKVVLHPKSVNYMEFNFHSQWLVYYQKLRSSKVFLHDTTNVQPFSLLFFGGWITFGKDLSCSTVFVDKHIAFHCPPRVAHLVKELREELDKLLQHKANHPGVTCWDPSTKEGALLKAIVELITSEDPLQSVEHTRQDDDDED